MTHSEWERSTRKGAQIIVRAPNSDVVVPRYALVATLTVMALATSPSHAAEVRMAGVAGSVATPVAVIAREQETPFSVPEALGEIRRRTAMTWDQLRQIFSVSRRAVHNWAAGEKLASINLEKVHELLGKVRSIKDARPFAVRRAVLAMYNVTEPTSLQVGPSIDPAILVADDGGMRTDIPTGKARKTKIIRV